MMIAATYGRVSDKSKQGDNFSVDTQLEKMKVWVNEQEWTLGYELRENASAYLEGLTRSELNKALELARSGRIQIFVFFSPDRFTRDMADGVILRRELKKLGVKLYCYWPTPHEILSDMEIMHILTDYQNQQFIERNKEASMRGYLGKVEMGLYSQGTPPYGYTLQGKKKDTVLSVNEEEAFWVRRIFQRYCYEDIGAADIATMLNSEHATLPHSTTGTREWTGRLVRHILGNETYAGVWYALRWQKVGKGKFKQRPKEEWKPIRVPSIVSRTLWDAARRKLDSRHVGRDSKGTWLLSSRIRCKCGSSGRGARNQSWYTKKNGERKVYEWYRCCSDDRLSGWCGLPHFQAKAVDDIVWSFAYDLIKNPEKLLKGYRYLQEQHTQEVDQLTGQIETLTERIAQQRDELTDLSGQWKRTQSKTVKAMLEGQMESLGLAIDEMEARLSSLQANVLTQPYTDAHIDAAIRELEQLREVYEALEHINEASDFEAKRMLLNILDLRVTMYVKDGQKWIDIHWLRRAYPRLVDSVENNNGTRHNHAINGAFASRRGG